MENPSIPKELKSKDPTHFAAGAKNKSNQWNPPIKTDTLCLEKVNYIIILGELSG